MAEYEELKSEPLGPDAQKLFEHLRSRVKGQEDAVSSLAKAIDLYNSGLKDPKKPILVALLIGPAATGKSLLVQSLAEYWFGSPDAYVQIPCSEFRAGIDTISNAGNFEKNKIYNDNKSLQKKVEENNKLVPEAQQIIRKIQSNDTNDKDREELKKKLEEIQDRIGKLRVEILGSFPENPKSIIVFDHMEWADEGFNSFLCGILDSGEVVDSQGGHFSLSNSVIFVICSNFINHGVGGKIGFSSESKNESRGEVQLPEKEAYLGSWDAVKNFFSRKFLSRFDRTYIFRELTKEAMKEIFREECRKFLNDLCGPMEFPLSAKMDKDVCDFIIQESMDHPEYGARLLRQKFDKYFRKPLARLKNRGLIKPGDKLVVKLNKEKNGVVFFKEKITGNPA